MGELCRVNISYLYYCLLDSARNAEGREHPEGRLRTWSEPAAPRHFTGSFPRVNYSACVPLANPSFKVSVLCPPAGRWLKPRASPWGGVSGVLALAVVGVGHGWPA